MEFLLKTILLMLGRLPDFFAEALSRCAGRFAARRQSKRLRQLRINVDQILGLPEHTSFAKTFYRQVFSSQLRCFLDTCMEICKPGSIQFDDLSNWQKIVRSVEGSDSGRSIIFAAAHIGAWELTGKVIALSCHNQVHALAKWPKVSGAGAVLQWLRKKFGMNVLWSHKKSLVRDMIGVLKKGEHLAMVIDQKPEARVGDTVNFFSHQIAFVGGPAAMSMRCNAPIISVATVKTGPRRYRVLGKLVYDPALASAPKSSAEVSQLIATEVEEWIQLYPEQWTWEYKRWVFKPDAL